MKKAASPGGNAAFYIFHSYPFKALKTNGIRYLIFTKAPDAHS